jgi:hypothetical protein
MSKEQQQNVESPKSEQGNKPYSEDDSRECPYCRELVRKDAVKCKYCRSFLTPEKPAHGGECPYCKESIHPEATRCMHCGSDLSVGAVSFGATPVSISTASGSGSAGCGCREVPEGAFMGQVSPGEAQPVVIAGSVARAAGPGGGGGGVPTERHCFNFTVPAHCDPPYWTAHGLAQNCYAAVTYRICVDLPRQVAV